MEGLQFGLQEHKQHHQEQDERHRTGSGRHDGGQGRHPQRQRWIAVCGAERSSWVTSTARTVQANAAPDATHLVPGGSWASSGCPTPQTGTSDTCSPPSGCSLRRRNIPPRCRERVVRTTTGGRCSLRSPAGTAAGTLVAGRKRTDFRFYPKPWSANLVPTINTLWKSLLINLIIFSLLLARATVRQAVNLRRLQIK